MVLKLPYNIILISEGVSVNLFRVPVIAAILWIGNFESKIFDITIED